MNNAASSDPRRTQCLLCGGKELALHKRGNLAGPATRKHLAVTDSAYGVTADVYRCRACGFAQCAGMGDVLSEYRELEDAAYEAGRRHRALQMRGLLRQLHPHCPGGRLLDIGAATGIFVEEARAAGYDAVGVEPAVAFQRIAAARGLPVHLGVHPHPGIQGKFDVVTLVDVIEHVDDPVGLVRDAAEALVDGGCALVVTPDLGSLVARVMGARWWHYRAAHINYFDARTLGQLLDRFGLHTIGTFRPGWVFSVDYLRERLAGYCAVFGKLPLPPRLAAVSIPVNSRDSLGFIVRKEAATNSE